MVWLILRCFADFKQKQVVLISFLCPFGVLFSSVDSLIGLFAVGNVKSVWNNTLESAICPAKLLAACHAKSHRNHVLPRAEYPRIQSYPKCQHTCVWNYQAKTKWHSMGQAAMRKTQLAQQAHARRAVWAATDSVVLKKNIKIGGLQCRSEVKVG